MNREDLIIRLKSIKDRLTALNSQLSSSTSDFVSRKAPKEAALAIATEWFQDIEPSLKAYGVLVDVLTLYHNRFDRLLKISLTATTRKSTFTRAIQEVLSNYIDEILIQVYKSAISIAVPNSLNEIILSASEAEREYLQEARDCIPFGYLRAAVILGWCAAVDRMQRVVQKLGFDTFNKKSEEMHAKTKGRYKRFDRKFHVSTLGEFRATVFDHDMLWVLEYWELLDSNQHERLAACYVMRNTSAHPGEAIITFENIASFFADLKNYVFSNPNLQLN